MFYVVCLEIIPDITHIPCSKTIPDIFQMLYPCVVMLIYLCPIPCLEIIPDIFQMLYPCVAVLEIIPDSPLDPSCRDAIASKNQAPVHLL